jgi:nitrate/TMAO reductase-like tetraheme cytochrome c subunit
MLDPPVDREWSHEMRTSRTFAPLVPLLAVFAAACSSDHVATDTTPYTREKLLDPETCKECHSEHYQEWSGSMHAYASVDPIFRAMNARGQKETGGMLGDFCVKCHAPMIVNEKVTTDYSDISSFPQKLQGVTCYFCHNVTDVTDTHNNPLVLANDVTMRGGILDPLKYKGHTPEYSKFFDDNTGRAALQSSSLCGSCHDIVVPSHFSGAPSDVHLERTFEEWKGSIFADALHPNGLNCASGCHMDTVAQVPIASPPQPAPTMPTRFARHKHDFPGVDTALVDFPEKDSQKAAINSLLQTEFRIQVCADPNTGNGIAVLLENLSAGHNFPSGASQDRRLWVELHAYQKDMEVFSSGVVPRDKPATSVEGTWVLYDQAFKADGQTEAHMFWEIASVKSFTIPTSTPDNVNNNQASKPFKVPLVNGKIPQIDRVAVTLWLEPMGREVLDELVQANELDAAIRDAMPRMQVTLVDGPDSGAPVTYEWTLEKALGPDGSQSSGRLCTENTKSKFSTVPAPL